MWRLAGGFSTRRQLLPVLPALVGVIVATMAIQPVVSFTVLPSSWHRGHRLGHEAAPSADSTTRQNKHHIVYQRKTTLSEQEGAAAAAVERGESLLFAQGDNNNDDVVDDDEDVSALRSVTFHNLPKNSIILDMDKDDHEAGEEGNAANEENDEAGPDLLADFLMEIGACSVSLTDADAGTDLESPLFHESLPVTSNNNNNNMAWQDSLHWAAPIWNRCNLTAHFPASVDIANVIQLVQTTFPQYQLYSLEAKAGEASRGASLQQEISIETVPNRDWVVHVQSSWKPIVVASSSGYSSSRNDFDHQQHIEDDDGEGIPQPHGSSGNNLFVLQFPWHAKEDVERAILLHEQTMMTTVADVKQPNQGGHLGDDVEMKKAEKKNIITIQLQGGIAFGTGEHATTQLCLQWLDRVIPRLVVEQQQQYSNISRDSDRIKQQTTTSNGDGLRILDYGAGSGILGIAALKLAAASAAAAAASVDAQQSTTTTTSATTAVGIDIDVDACRIANANAIINNVSQFKTYLPPLAKTMDDESKSLLLKARAHAARQQQKDDVADNGNLHDDDDGVLMTLPREQQDALYDVCVANILAAPLIALAPEIVSMLKPGTGWLGMSGILPQQGPAVVQAYIAAGLERVVIEQEMGGWILVTGQRRRIN